jgi:hypothetical protein
VREGERDFSDDFVGTAREEAARLRTRAVELRARGEAWQNRGTELLRQAELVESRVRELDELLGTAPQLRIDLQTEVLRGAALRSAAVRVLAECHGVNHPVHYRDWYELLSQAGLRAGGKDPVATFLTEITRSGIVERAGRAGVYQLNPQKAYERARTSVQLASDRLAQAQAKLTTGAQPASTPSSTETSVAAGKALDELQRAQRQLQRVLAERSQLTVPSDGERMFVYTHVPMLR